MATCRYCGRYFSESHYCSSARRTIRAPDGADALVSLGISAAVGAATDSAILGGLVGGSIAGGILGDVLNSGGDGGIMDSLFD